MDLPKPKRVSKASHLYIVSSCIWFPLDPFLTSTGSFIFTLAQPCTAYNYFFHEERQRLLDELPERTDRKLKSGPHGKVSFSDMAKIISARWKKVTAEQMIRFAGLANADKLRYRNEMADYKDLQRHLQRQAQARAQAEAQAEAHFKALAQAQAQESDTYDPIHVHTQRDMMEPFISPHYNNPNPSIQELADKLDNQSIDFLVAVLK